MIQVLIASSALLWVIALFNLLLVLALIRRINAEPQQGGIEKQGPEVGQLAPDFKAETLQGEVVTLSTYTGRPTAFIFVSPRCGPCIEALPSYITLHPIAERANIQFVMVSVGDTEETRTFVDEFDISIPLLLAPVVSNDFLKDYNFSGTPYYCFIDAQGKVQSAGYPSLEDWSEWKTLTESWKTGESRLAMLPFQEKEVFETET